MQLVSDKRKAYKDEARKSLLRRKWLRGDPFAPQRGKMTMLASENMLAAHSSSLFVQFFVCAVNFFSGYRPAFKVVLS